MRLTPSEISDLLRLAADRATAIRRPLSRALTQLKVARCCAARNNPVLAKRLVSTAESTIQELRGADKGLVLAELGFTSERLGESERASQFFSAAKSLAGELGGQLEKYGILYRLAELYCDLCQREQAMELAQEVTDAPYKSTILTAIVNKSIEAGDLVAAFDTSVQMCESSALKAEIILHLVNRGHMSAAEREALTHACDAP